MKTRDKPLRLVLSLMPGIDLLGMAFKAEGFCVVQGGDVIFGGDVRTEHYPPGKFDGIIAGPPCQMFSRLSHMVRHNGHEPKFGNLIPEFERCVTEAQPTWYLMEEVIDAPRPKVDGYENHEFTLNNRQCFDEGGKAADQNRVRAITFGCRGRKRVLMIETAALHSRTFEYAACGGGGGAETPVALGGSGNPKPSMRKNQRLNSAVGWNIKSKASFANACRKQGLPEGCDLPGFTVEAKCKAIGNGVPLPMGRAIAKAVMEATQ